MASQADDLQRMLEAKMDTFLKSHEFKDTLTASILEAIGDVIRAAVTPLKEAIDKECQTTCLVYTTDGFILVKRKNDNKIFRIKREEDLITSNLR